MVYRVYSGSSADNAGIRAANRVVLLFNREFPVGGDIITEIDGRPVGSPEELRLALEPKRSGDTVQVTIYRGRSRIQRTITLIEARRQRTLRF
jgi:S1-C subfamily serine protease